MKDIVAMAQELGEFVTGDDGYVYYWPKGTGAYTAHDLRLLADELDKRNDGWDAHINAYFAAAQEDGDE